MIEFKICDENIQMTHARYHQLNCDILTTINPILRDLYTILLDNLNPILYASKYMEERNFFSLKLKEMYDEVDATMVSHCPSEIVSLLYQEEISSEMAGRLLDFFAENYTKNTINNNSKELFKKLCSLLEKSVKLDKNIKKIEDD